jgi:hypothetical protein
MLQGKNVAVKRDLNTAHGLGHDRVSREANYV